MSTPALALKEPDPFVFPTTEAYEAADAAEEARFIAEHGDDDPDALWEHMCEWERIHDRPFGNVPVDPFVDTYKVEYEPSTDPVEFFGSQAKADYYLSPSVANLIAMLDEYHRGNKTTPEQDSFLADLKVETAARAEAARVSEVAWKKDEEAERLIRERATKRFLEDHPDWEAEKRKLLEKYWTTLSAEDSEAYDNPPDLETYVQRKLEHQPNQPKELHLSRRFRFVLNAGAFFDLMTWTLVPEKTVRLMLRKHMPKEYMGQGGGMAAFLMDRCTPVDKLSYAPDKPREYVDSNKLKCLNVYRPSSLEVPRFLPRDATPWLTHVYHMFGDDIEAREHFLDWLAFKTQHPGRKIRHAVVIHGAQGIGKDSLAYPLHAIFGNNMCAPDNEEALKGKTMFLENKTLILIQELKSGDNYGLYDKLKPVITETSVRIEPKFINPYTIECPAAILAFTNHENCLRLEDGDRRWWLYSSKMQKREPAYYADLYKWYEGGGCRAVASYLLNRDVSGFNPDAHPPLTSFKAEVLEASRGETRNGLLEMWQDRQGPFSKPFVNLRDALKFLRETDFPKLGEDQLKRFIRQHGGQPYSPWEAAEKVAPTRYKRNGQSVQARLWLLRGAPADWKGKTQEEIGEAVWHSQIG